MHPRSPLSRYNAKTGVALVPESAARAHPEHLRPLPIVRPRMRGRVALAWPSPEPVVE